MTNNGITIVDPSAIPSITLERFQVADPTLGFEDFPSKEHRFQVSLSIISDSENQPLTSEP